MGSVNMVVLVGNLGKDAELRYTPNGAAVAKFSMATTETWNDKQGQRQERTEWHYCDVWGKTAESLAEYLKKGKQVYVQGRLQTDEYTDRDGVKRKATKIRVDRITLLGGPRADGESSSRRSATQDDAREFASGHGAEPSAEEPGMALSDDDIPF